MKQEIRVEFEYDNIKSYVVDDIAVIKITCNAFGTISDLDTANRVLPWFDLIEKTDSIKSVIVVSEKDCLGEEAYEQFLSNVTGRKIDQEENKEITKFEKAEIRAIEINTLVNLIRKILSFKKIFVTAYNGEVVTPFFGISLAGDYRIGTNDMKILLSHVKYGLHPTGMLPLFLPEYLNRQLAVKYLLSGGIINGEEALKYNLVNDLLSNDEFEKKTIEKVKEYSMGGMNFIKNTKSLLNRSLKEFENFVQLEANFTYK